MEVSLLSFHSESNSWRNVSQSLSPLARSRSVFTFALTAIVGRLGTMSLNMQNFDDKHYAREGLGRGML